MYVKTHLMYHIKVRFFNDLLLWPNNVFDSVRGFCDLGFLDGFRWKMHSGECKCSSFYWLATETWQAVENFKGSLHIVNHRGLDVLRLLKKRGKLSRLLIYLYQLNAVFSVKQYVCHLSI